MEAAMDNIEKIEEAAEQYRRRMGVAPPIFPYLGMDGLLVALREATEQSAVLTVDSLAARLGITPRS
jgi:hypothetical protein